MDPITLAALISGGTALLKGVAGGIGAQSQAKAEKERAAEMMKVATELREGALGRRREYGMGPSYSDLRQLVLQDPTSDYLRQQAQRQEAGQIEALQAGGARSVLGGTQAVAQSTMDRLAQIAQDEQIRKAKGLQVVGEAEQRIAREKLADARSDLDFGRLMTAEAQGARFGAEDLSRLGKQQMYQSGIEGLGALGIASQADKLAVKDPEILGMVLEDGGLVRGKTPGEFSHEENPIDIIQDGQKIGEMTGGEGVVSPEDLGKLEQLAGQGKTPLHKFVRGLIKKLESNG